uniref:RING-type domain-containing protein n=1 Tax=Globisporangium ultimum (strain ATCC 200006 / CBS 805.95 / DAOM BR144) TaxID=431595 RepID=K3X160_GLOUD
MNCRDCGRAQARDRIGQPLVDDVYYPLTCGDTYCRACLASVARSSLHVHDLIPLRCCHRRVPREWIDEVLEKPEAGYYAFLLEKKKSALPRDQGANAPGVQFLRKQVRCKQCGAAVGQSTMKKMPLLCGHVYCLKCLGALCEIDKEDGVAPTCCDLPISTEKLIQVENAKTLRVVPAVDNVSPSKNAVPALQTIVIDDDVSAAAANVHDLTAESPKQGRRQSKRILSLSGTGKQKTSPQAAANEVNLVDASDAAENTTTASESTARPKCFTCNKFVLTTDSACGHSFCLKCIGDRCRQAIKNDNDGGIGLPLRCCDELLPLEMIRPALSRQAFANYKALVAKREDDIKQLTKRKRDNGKQKAAASTVTKKADAPPTKKAKVAADADDEEKAPTPREDVPVECVACMDQIPVSGDQFRGPCGHVYCSGCLAFMAKKSLKDRALVPIRCCGKELPIDYVSRVLSKRSMSTYNRFLHEKNWKTSNLKSDKDYATLVKIIGGKQCPKCGIGVQKIAGCNSMACSRGHRFCWACEAHPCTCYRNLREAYYP